MTLTSTTATIRAQCSAQLYDEWHGFYMLRRLFMSAWIDVRPLDRAEALTYRCKSDEAVELKWPQSD